MKKLKLEINLLPIQYLDNGRIISLRKKVNKAFSHSGYMWDCKYYGWHSGNRSVAESYSTKSGEYPMEIRADYQKLKITIIGEERRVHGLGRKLQRMLFKKKEMIPNPKLKRAEITY